MRREITARDDRRLFAAGARSPVASTASSGLVHTARFSLLRTLLVPLMCCSAARAMSQPGGRGLPRVSSWAPPASISAACFRDTFAGGATKGRWEVAHGGVSRSQQFRRGEAVGRSTRGGVAAAARGVWMKANKKNKRKREQRQVGGGGEGVRVHCVCVCRVFVDVSLVLRFFACGASLLLSDSVNKCIV